MADDVQPIRNAHADRSQLQQIIAGLTEGVILVDPDQTILWANEAALDMHGAQAVADLGDSVSEYRRRFQLRYRNNHSLSKGDYPIDRVVAGEAFTDVVVEVTPAGEDEPRWVHRVRSLVITDAAGLPDCLVLVIQDATERFSAEERFEATFNANPAPAVICRLSDLRYVKVNQGFLEMTGYAREDVIGRSVYEVDILEGAENRDLAKERLSEWRTVPQMEAELSLPGGGTKLVIVAGQPLEIGEERCVLFSFADLEPRRKAETALRQSERRFEKAFRLAPAPMTVSLLKDFRILDANEAFCSASGYSLEEIIGRSPAEIELWDNSATRRRMEDEVRRSGGFRNLEVRLKAKEGHELDCLVSAETVEIQDQDCVLSVLQDITDRKHSEIELVAAIEAVMQDTTWFSRNVMDKLANLRAPGPRNGADRNPSALTALTKREHDVLGMICQGLDDEAIAQGLGVSRNTVRNHVARIYNKIDVHRRSDAVIWARERGFSGRPPEPSRVTAR